MEGRAARSSDNPAPALIPLVDLGARDGGVLLAEIQ